MIVENEQIHVCPDAVTAVNSTRPLESRFTEEDLDHLVEAYRAIEARSPGMISMPGFEAVLAKVYREIYGTLPPTHPTRKDAP